MAWSEDVKELAYELDPECWESYSGKAKAFKQGIDRRRSAALKEANRRLAERNWIEPEYVDMNLAVESYPGELETLRKLAVLAANPPRLVKPELATPLTNAERDDLLTLRKRFEDMCERYEKKATECAKANYKVIGLRAQVNILTDNLDTVTREIDKLVARVKPE